MIMAGKMSRSETQKKMECSNPRKPDCDGLYYWSVYPPRVLRCVKCGHVVAEEIADPDEKIEIPSKIPETPRTRIKESING